MPDHDLDFYLEGSYQVTLSEEATPGGESIWIARVNAMPGCIAQGPDYDSAARQLELAFGVYVRNCFEHGAPLPEPDLPQGTGSRLQEFAQHITHVLEDDSFVVYPWEPGEPATA